MIRLNDSPVTIRSGAPAPGQGEAAKTLARAILAAHDLGAHSDKFQIRFDSLISHDITYVGIIQTALAGGLKEFPLRYALTNCHNSLCAVGGTINEDDHLFGLSAAKRFGGEYVPANLAVIHQYARERLAACGGMVLGSDSHTRYGALGALGVGEGGPELVKQLLGDRWELKAPGVLLVWLTGAPRRGVGPHDAALALCRAVYENNFAKNRILEFAGPGLGGLSMDWRMGLDVMTTETACLSSVWETDEKTRDWLALRGREADYKKLSVSEGAGYDGLIEMDLSKIEPMIALPYHPSNAYAIRELNENPGDVLREAEKKAGLDGALTALMQEGGLFARQGLIAGCAGGLAENLREAAAILKAGTICEDFSLSVYPASLPVEAALQKDGALISFLSLGVPVKPCFCGPCFGAGEVPANGTLSLRHTTRNFPCREGAKPSEGQFALTALMDARSIAATAIAGGRVNSAMDVDWDAPAPAADSYDAGIYERRVYAGFGRPRPAEPLRYGPNIAPWPAFEPLNKHILIKLAAVLTDPVTTTDELIPSGETSSYRSNPERLSEYALSRRDPGYVARAKAVRAESAPADTTLGSAIAAVKPGDGSAREQAASCQRVLGGRANIAREYATRRYRANLINWGILPFVTEAEAGFFRLGDELYIENIREKLLAGETEFTARLERESGAREDIVLRLPQLSVAEREILLEGCLMNHYAAKLRRG